MPILYIILVLVIIGLVMYLIETYVPMPPPFRLILRVVVIILVLIWLLQVIGAFGPVVRIT